MINNIDNKIVYIKKNHEFQKIINKKNQLVTPNIIFFITKNSHHCLRFGLSVGKSLGNAVKRNKTRRQLRMIIQEFYKSNFMLFNNGFDIVLLVRKNYFNNSFENNTQFFFKKMIQILNNKNNKKK